MEKLPFTRPVPGAKWFGDSCLQEQQVIFRKGERALRSQVGDVIVIKFIWVCPVLTCVESIFLDDELLGRGFMMIKFLWDYLSSGR